MTFGTLIRRSLRFHWRSHLGVVMGASVGSAALIGALVVGDSVKASLREQALKGLGNVHYALAAHDRTFDADLLNRMLGRATNETHAAERHTPSAPTLVWGTGTFWDGSVALQLAGSVSRPDNEARANAVQCYGVDQPFFRAFMPSAKLAPGTVCLNQSLAQQLHAQPGDRLVFRLHKPSSFSPDASIARRDDSSIALTLVVLKILPDWPGSLKLRVSPTTPLNAFLSIEELQRAVGMTGRANLVLAGYALQVHAPHFSDKLRIWIRDVGHGQNPLKGRLISTGDLAPGTQGVQVVQRYLRDVWTLADAQAQLVRLTNRSCVELKSSRIFLDPPLVKSAGEAATNIQPLMTYLANLLQSGTNATPYSMVTAAGPPWTPADLHDDEIVVNRWLAKDLQVKPGDEIALIYFDPESGARLTERTNRFRVRSIVPMEMPWSDRTLMPDFPGIEKAENASDWDAGFPLVYKIRSQDEKYWHDYRGTPKAFVTLAAGQKMWGNRFGNLTAIRFPLSTNAQLSQGPQSGDGSSARPHPDPLPQEREKSPATSGATVTGRNAIDGEKMGATQLLSLPQESERLLSPSLSSIPNGGEGGRRPGEEALRGSGAQSAKWRSENSLPEGEGQGENHPQSPRIEPLNGARSIAPRSDGGPTGGAMLRAPVHGGEAVSADTYRPTLEKKILAGLKPEDLGLRFEPVREQALQAAEHSQDFGGLFIGFSFFLIIAALLLMAMLFQFGLEQRISEVGTLLALGFTTRQVRTLLLGEAVTLAFFGGIVGVFAGTAYARAMLHGLTTIWRDAIGSSALSYHSTTQTLVIGLIASVLVSTVTIWLTMRKLVKRPLRALLVGEAAGLRIKTASRTRMIAAAALIGAVGLVGWAWSKGDTANAEVFFSAGSLVLIAGLSYVSARLARLRGQKAELTTSSASTPKTLRPSLTLSALGVRGCARRRKRSLATVAMLACGTFLIVSIGVFRLDANRDATRRSSGTGGFALIGETTLPVFQDLNRRSGLESFTLDKRDLAGVSFVPFRVHEGDEASCLNLNGAPRPRLLGVNPRLLEGHFTLAKGTGWMSLRENGHEDVRSEKITSENPQPAAAASADEIPAIGDANSIQWAMHKKVGDTIEYVDDRGQPFKVRIVGAVANSILQGQLIIDEQEFVKRFPNQNGYRTFLIDAPTNSVPQVSATLSRAMQDVGLELVPAVGRLNQFNAVQNTYLGTFQVLGGLGLLLGSVGLGIVVLRNVLERRDELALLLAVGYRATTLQKLLLIEHGALLGLGLAIGVAAAAVAVLPSVLSPNLHLPFQSLALTLLAVLANGALWTWVATKMALRGNLLAALRNE